MGRCNCKGMVSFGWVVAQNVLPGLWCSFIFTSICGFFTAVAAHRSYASAQHCCDRC
jgi:hypothetical protein